MTAALHEWHEFYLLIGTAGGTLVALLFVAASIGVGFFTHEGAPATRTYISPVIIHFTAVLFISALGLGAAARSAAVRDSGRRYRPYWICRRARHHGEGVRRPQPPRRAVYCFAYGVIPAVSYVVIAAAGIMFAVSPDRALHIMAAGLLLLLLINIRNAWDLVLTVVRLQGAREKRKRKQKR